MSPLMWFMVLLHFWVGLSLYVILKWALQELEGHVRLVPPFKGEHLKGMNKPARTYPPRVGPTFPNMNGLKYPTPRYPHYYWVDHRQ